MNTIRLYKSILKIRRGSRTIAGLSGLLLFAAFTSATPGFAREETHRPKIGLVLSGGGARGAAHVGVLQVLEELRVPVDYIAGTSMGSIVGGLYAMGMPPDEIGNTFAEIDWDDAFQDTLPREERSYRRKRDDDLYLVKQKPGFRDWKIRLPSGLIQGQKIGLILKSLTLPAATIRDFDALPIPYRAVATDITTGEAVALGSGDLATAMRASMSVPPVFAAVEIDGRLLVDGGISDNLPVELVRNMGADVLIVVDISTPLKERDKLDSAVGIAGQLSGILTRRTVEEQLRKMDGSDILLVPELNDISSASFKDSPLAIPRGFDAAEKQRKRLEALSLSENDYAAYKNALKKLPDAPPVIDDVEILNRSRLGDDMLEARLRVPANEPLDVPALEKNIGRIYGLDLFEHVSYSLTEEDNRTGLVVEARERSWGPNYLQFGLAFSAGGGGDNTISLGTAYTRTAINRLNGEWRLGFQLGDEPAAFTEIHQPLDVNSRYFIAPRLKIENRKVNTFDNTGSRTAKYEVQEYGGDIAAGREFGTWGELRLGYRRLAGDAELVLGSRTQPDFDYDKGEIFLRLSVDKLDNFNFPGEGVFGHLEWVGSRESLGADSNFDQIVFNGLGAGTLGQHTFFGFARGQTTLKDDAPLQNLFRAGGLFNLSGFNHNELSGQHFGLAVAGYYYTLEGLDLFPVHLGGTLEAGNVWKDRKNINFAGAIPAGSVFLGIDTMLGPLFVAWGYAEGGRDSFYFFLGRPPQAFVDRR